ncbi:MAG: hypothetical protein Q9209_003116 [Squamulea sp. 1 TL-2023]
MADPDELTNQEGTENSDSRSASGNSKDTDNYDADKDIEDLIHALRSVGAFESENTDDMGASHDAEDANVPEERNDCRDEDINQNISLGTVTVRRFDKEIPVDVPIAMPGCSNDNHETKGSIPLSLDHQQYQPGLGTLSLLPIEVRSKVWQMYLPMLDSAIQGKPSLDPRRQRPLSRKEEALGCLRASQQLYHEVSAEFYRNRTLTINFSCDHHLGSTPGMLRPTVFFVRFQSSSAARNLEHINFSAFASVELDIELPDNMKVYYELGIHLGEFVQLISKWQSSMKSKPTCPPMHIAVRLHPNTEARRVAQPNEWVSQISIFCFPAILMPLKDIQNAESAFIKLHFKFSEESAGSYMQRQVDEIAKSMQQSGKRSPGEVQLYDISRIYKVSPSSTLPDFDFFSVPLSESSLFSELLEVLGDEAAVHSYLSSEMQQSINVAASPARTQANQIRSQIDLAGSPRRQTVQAINDKANGAESDQKAAIEIPFGLHSSLSVLPEDEFNFRSSNKSRNVDADIPPLVSTGVGLESKMPGSLKDAECGVLEPGDSELVFYKCQPMHSGLGLRLL